MTRSADDALVREAREKIAKAQAMVVALCARRGAVNAREWVMSIPARPDYDPDLVIGDALRAALAALAALSPTAADKADAGRTEEEHAGVFLHFGDGRIKMSPGAIEGVPMLCMQPGDWGQKAGDRHDGLPSKYWTKRDDVTLTFKNVAGLDALLAELTDLRAKQFPEAPAPAAASEGRREAALRAAAVELNAASNHIAEKDHRDSARAACAAALAALAAPAQAPGEGDAKPHGCPPAHDRA